MPRDDSALAGFMLNKALKEACESPRRRPWASWLIGVIFGLLGLTAVAWGVFWLAVVADNWGAGEPWGMMFGLILGLPGSLIIGLITMSAWILVSPDRNLPKRVRLGITGMLCVGFAMQIIVLALSLIAS